MDAVPAEGGPDAVFVLVPVAIGERVGGAWREAGSAGRARSDTGARNVDVCTGAGVYVDALFTSSGWAGMMFASCCGVLLR